MSSSVVAMLWRMIILRVCPGCPLTLKLPPRCGSQRTALAVTPSSESLGADHAALFRGERTSRAGFSVARRMLQWKAYSQRGGWWLCRSRWFLAALLHALMRIPIPGEPWRSTSWWLWGLVAWGRAPSPSSSSRTTLWMSTTPPSRYAF